MDNLHVHSKTSTTRNRNCLLPELGDFVTMTIIAKTKINTVSYVTNIKSSIFQDQDQQQTTQRQQPE